VPTWGMRVEALKVLRGAECGKGVSLSHWGGSWEEAVPPTPPSRNFLAFEWKIVHFGAFWVLFLQTAVI